MSSLVRFLTQSSRARRVVTAPGLLFLSLALGCDDFQRSVCERESLPGCSPASLPDLNQPRPLPPVLGRRFERRASLPRGSSQSLAGLVGRRVVLSTRGPMGAASLGYYDIDLDNQDSGKRFALGGIRTVPDYKNISTIKFIAKTEPQYHVLDGYKIFKVDIIPGGTAEVLGECQTSGMLARPFAHQQMNALAATCGGTKIAAWFPASQRQDFAWDGQSPPDALTMADWSDPVLGQTLIAFGPGSVRLFSQSVSRNEDSEWQTLQAQLASALSVGSTGLAPVEAAYVADVDGDPYRDLVFARAGKVWGLSYRGADRANGGGAFVAWPESLLDTELESQDGKVSALLLANLDLDVYPDLVIETEKTVLLYRSVAWQH